MMASYLGLKIFSVPDKEDFDVTSFMLFNFEYQMVVVATHKFFFILDLKAHLLVKFQRTVIVLLNQ